MSDNRYAPPSARVADAGEADDAPPLWNPNAAANWSLLFTPAFGAYLHMRNWEALGETRRAAASRNWIYATVAVIVGSSLVRLLVRDNPGLLIASQLSGLALLLSWYFSSARAQAGYVKRRFGAQYERLGWGKPLLVGLGVLIGFYFIVGLFIGVFMRMRNGG